VSIVFWLPHLRLTDDVATERPFESACGVHGYPTPRECLYFMDETALLNTPLLELATDRVMLPVELRDALERTP
jgi:hypothetical protein